MKKDPRVYLAQILERTSIASILPSLDQLEHELSE